MGETLVEIRATVRREMLDRVVRALKEAGVPRFSVIRVHSIGAGVDPAAVRMSWDEGSEYADKALVQFICSSGRSPQLVDVVTEAAHTGRRGDGIVALYPVDEVVKIRTGAKGLAALD